VTLFPENDPQSDWTVLFVCGTNGTVSVSVYKIILVYTHTHTHNGTVQYSNTVSTDHPHTFVSFKTAKLHT